MRRGICSRWFAYRYALFHPITPMYLIGSYYLKPRFRVSLSNNNELRNRVDEEKLQQIYHLLPHGNCGLCGYSSCRDLAYAIVTGDASPDLCRMIDDRIKREIKEILDRR